MCCNHINRGIAFWALGAKSRQFDVTLWSSEALRKGRHSFLPALTLWCERRHVTAVGLQYSWKWDIKMNILETFRYIFLWNLLAGFLNPQFFLSESYYSMFYACMT